MNKIIFTLILTLFTIVVNSQTNEFNNYIKKTYSKYDNKYNLEKEFESIFKLKIDSSNKYDFIINVTSKILEKTQEDKFLNSKNIIHGFSFETKNYIVLSYFELVKTDEDWNVYSWLKSYNNNGLIIDSLCTLEYSNNEGISIRMISEIDFGDTIKINFNKKYFEEIGQHISDKYSNIKLAYKLDEAFFLCIQDAQNPIFKNIYEYMTLDDIILRHMGGCYLVKKINYGDVNNDGFIDLVIELKSKKVSCSWILFDYDILICFSNKKNEFFFVRPQMHIDLNDNEFVLDNLEIKNDVISFDLIFKKNNILFKFYYKYDSKVNNWLLVKVYNMTKVQWFYPDKKIVMQGAKSVALKLMD